MSTTPTERRLSITPGEAYVDNAGDVCVGELAVAIMSSYFGDEADVANATLYADAHNTYNACGLTPSELLAKLKQAEDVVVHMVSAAKYHFKHGNDTNLDKQTDIADAFLSTLNLPQ